MQLNDLLPAGSRTGGGGSLARNISMATMLMTRIQMGQSSWGRFDESVWAVIYGQRQSLQKWLISVFQM
jgi:hypothetical protein